MSGRCIGYQPSRTTLHIKTSGCGHGRQKYVSYEQSYA